MNMNGQIAEQGACQMATARLDRSATEGSSRRRIWPAVPSRIAMLLRIPVGYQDETGFHCGEERVQEALPLSEQEKRFSDPYRI